MRTPAPISLSGFRSRKAAQVAAYFVAQHGGQIDKLKLIKLIYLVERESIKSRKRPMLYDEYYSLEHGPICSNTLKGINGEINADIWSQYIAKVGNKTVNVANAKLPDLDEVSKSDLKILESVWSAFGWMETSVIRRWTHDNCPEYVEVEPRTRLPITHDSIAQAVGLDDPGSLAQRVNEYRRMEVATSR